MAGEIVGELLGAAVEGAMLSGGDNDKKSSAGCLIFFIIIIAIGVFSLVHFGKSVDSAIVKGVITHKLKNNQVLLRTKNGEDLYHISEALYENKKVGDSLILNDYK